MTRYPDSNMDTVVELEELGAGVEEILQYAVACFTRDQVRALIWGLERQIDAKPASPVCVEEVREAEIATEQVSTR